MPGYYSGFSNLRMALDIAVVLAHLTGRTLVPYRFRMPRRHALAASAAPVWQPMLVPELFDLPVPHQAGQMMKTWLSTPGAAECHWPALYNAVFCDAARPDDDDPRFQAFRNGRRHVLGLTAAQRDAADLHISTEALAHYSHFFYLDPQRQADVVQLMRQLQPRAPYRQAIDDIVAGLGEFNALHLRRGDFLSNGLARGGFIRSTQVTGAEIVANLAPHLHRDTPLLICTDGDPDEPLFGALLQHFRQVVFLHQHLQTPGVAARLAALPRFDEDVEALLTQGVAAQARVFAGTLFSTFTALIHRQRALQRGERHFRYAYDDFCSPIARYEQACYRPSGDGPFSWNQLRMPVTPEVYSWLREWPEAAGLALPVDPAAPAADRCITLSAAQAECVGAGPCQALNMGLPPLLQAWAADGTLAHWPLHLDKAGAWDVTLRYAAPGFGEQARFELGVDGQTLLQGTVWGTCSTDNLSPWMPLGRLDLPAGASRLVLRLCGGTGATAVRWQGVQLRPA